MTTPSFDDPIFQPRFDTWADVPEMDADQFEAFERHHAGLFLEQLGETDAATYNTPENWAKIRDFLDSRVVEGAYRAGVPRTARNFGFAFQMLRNTGQLAVATTPKAPRVQDLPRPPQAPSWRPHVKNQADLQIQQESYDRVKKLIPVDGEKMEGKTFTQIRAAMRARDKSLQEIRREAQAERIRLAKDRGTYVLRERGEA